MKMFDADKTRMIALPYGEKNCDNMLSRFHLIPERYGQTDGQTERIAISISAIASITAAVRATAATVDRALYRTNRHGSVNLVYHGLQHGRPGRREENITVVRFLTRALVCNRSLD